MKVQPPDDPACEKAGRTLITTAARTGTVRLGKSKALALIHGLSGKNFWGLRIV